MSGEKTKLVPKLRFPEFRSAAGWMEQFGGSLFDQISDRNPEPGLPVLAICRIPDDCIDSKRYPLFMARDVMRVLIEQLQAEGATPS